MEKDKFSVIILLICKKILMFCSQGVLQHIKVKEQNFHHKSGTSKLAFLKKTFY